MSENRNKIIQNKQKNYFYRVLFIGVFLLVLALIISSPIFQIKEIQILGNENVSIEEVKSQMQVWEGKNIFSVISLKATKDLEKIPYVKSCKIKKDYPNKLIIEISERKPRAYVERKSVSSYILIDSKGMVLSVEPAIDITKKLPVIVGLDFSDVVLGQPLKTSSETSFKNAVLFSQLFEKYEMEDIVKLELSNEKDIHIYCGKINVSFGSVDNIDEKIRALKQYVIELKKIFDEPIGFLDISDINKEPIFKQLK